MERFIKRHFLPVLASILLLTFMFVVVSSTHAMGGDGIGYSGPAGGVTAITAGTNITISPANGTGNVTINSSASGGGSADLTSSGTPVDLLQTGDVFYDSTTWGSGQGVPWPVGLSTVQVVAMQPYCIGDSTVGAVLNSTASVVMSVWQTSPTVPTIVNPSSFTIGITPVLVSTGVFGDWWVPPTTTIWYPQSMAILKMVSIPASGTLPNTCGVKVEYFPYKRSGN